MEQQVLSDLETFVGVPAPYVVRMEGPFVTYVNTLDRSRRHRHPLADFFAKILRFHFAQRLNEPYFDADFAFSESDRLLFRWRQLSNTSNHSPSSPIEYAQSLSSSTSVPVNIPQQQQQQYQHHHQQQQQQHRFTAANSPDELASSFPSPPPPLASPSPMSPASPRFSSSSQQHHQQQHLSSSPNGFLSPHDAASTAATTATPNQTKRRSVSDPSNATRRVIRGLEFAAPNWQHSALNDVFELPSFVVGGGKSASDLPPPPVLPGR